MVQIVFRVDSSLEIGSGHLQRCLTLALVLRKRGAEVFFICRKLPGNSIALVERQDFEVFSLPYDDKGSFQASELDGLPQHGMWLREHLQTDIAQTKKCLSSLSEINQGAIDWLIADHYALDIEWERVLRSYCKHLMIIDDLADRYHDCEVLLDQNFYSNYQYRYQKLVPKNCNLLLGPKYALLRPEFGEMHRHIKVRNGKISNILIFMGGSDATNETKKVLRALEKINFIGSADVIVGYSNPYRDEIETICKKHENYRFYCQVDNMAELMNKADLAIGAGGSTTWERCCLGLPSLVIGVAENQVILAQDADRAQLLVYLGKASEVSVEEIVSKVSMLMASSSLTQLIGKNGYMLVDGCGCGRVAQIIYNQVAGVDKQ